MRSHLVKLFILLLLPFPASAQVNAGDVPPGTSVLNPGIDLQLIQAFTIASDSIDLDCDGVADIRAEIIQRDPPSDAPHSCHLELLDTSLTLCTDTTPFYWRPNYFTHGGALVCPSGSSWQADTVVVLGNIGGWGAVGPWIMDSMYVAYQKGNTIGWILLSFDLSGGIPGQPIFLQIHQVLLQCLTNSVAPQVDSNDFLLYPNPVNDQLTIELNNRIGHHQLTLYDTMGRIVRTESMADGELTKLDISNLAPGVYSVTMAVDSQKRVKRFVKE